MKLFRIFILAFFTISLIACGGAEERKAVYMEKAKASIEIGDLDKARIELKNVLQIDPKDAEAHYQLGKIFESKGDYRKAFGNYKKAAELNPDHLENQAKLGRFYLLLANDVDKAQEKINLILSKDPKNSDGLLLKAAVTLRNKNSDAAIMIVKNIISQDPGHVESVAFLSSLYVKDKKLTNAIGVLDAALKINKNNQRLNKLLASALVANKDYKRAEVLYKNFLEKNPGSRLSYNNLAAFYNQMGNKVKAEEVLRASVDSDPSDKDRILTLTKFIREVKGSDEAIAELERYISENSGLGGLRIALAELFILDGDNESAAKVLKQAIDDFPEEVTGVTARTVLASVYISDNALDKASEVVEDALSISPNDPQVNYLRAKFAVRDKDMEKAIISLRITTKEMPENISAFLLLAAVYQQEGNKEQAVDILNTAYESNRANADALLKLAQYYLNRDIKKAEKIIDTYNNIKGSDYAGLSIKAALLNQNKKYTEAYEIAKVLMNEHPDKPNGYLQAVPYSNQQGDRNKAISVLEEGYAKATDKRKILALLTSLQLSEKQFDVVVNRLKAEIKKSPEDESLRILLAKVYAVNNNLDATEQLLNEVVNISPQTEEAYLLLSQIYQSKKDISAVKEILIKGRENVKDSLKIPFRLASVYEAEGAYKDAVDIYRKLYQAYPDNLLIANNLASMLSDYKDGKNDLSLTKELIGKLEENKRPIFLDTIGWAYFKLGEQKKAIQYLFEATEKSPEVNVFNYHLGMAYKMSGDKIQAKTYLEKSIADDKKFKGKDLAKAALKDL